VRRGAVACALLLLLVGAACGERAEPLGATAPLYPLTVQQGAEAPTVLRSKPKRIVALARPYARELALLGARDRLVGRNLAGLNGPALVDGIAAAKPDLIVAAAETDAADLQRARRRTSAAVFVAPDSSIRGVERATDELGLLMDEPVAARRAVQRMESAQADADRRLQGVRPVKVFVDTGFFGTVGDSSLLGDLVRAAGGENVAGANPESGPFDLGALARLRPQVYLATSDSGTTLKKLRRNPRTRGLPAVKAGRFYTVDARLVEPGLQLGQALRTIGKLLHPNAFH
jgi:ABC-type Fe3+-hydroxamate transport system substrate-binding protein